ncbi:HAMP domain-containing histidine kinase [Clostridium tagluense]|uniref:sensor histidine kinase n=1 Tax=Clostridium tagluense TaxID=360422 RepID=UPI001CF3B874|nr:HAMP domain-containing sensor histidine kinase [Clostridium tagluense]MCB2310332.1 HAMP domain-containing histidine kinase [Clostridium tagluense]MCB2315026.1 HAMP domain-containing histidine kinase [Clostridium tagluense]MCB2320032.1 HAMP domain-containing histidine kinase [Clostridium tagluense]MCB2324769.1 HAMP domain-containing histidine kinase [Clostridium tagluense]MCB2329777.1 HAMP domain-containing histidine kinase [Clostridium tagluense]
MRSIKTRLTVSYLILIILIVVIFESILMVSIKKYYNNTIENILKNQAEISSNFYAKYFVDTDISTASNDITGNFSYLTDSEIQIVDTNGIVINDNKGVSTGIKIKSPDIDQAIKGGIGVFKGKSKESQESIMAVSKALTSKGKAVGVIRFITSMEMVNKLLKNIFLILVLIGVLVILATAILSFIMSKTIIEPLKAVTNAANQMASGKFSIRIDKKYNDEVGVMVDTLNYMSEEILKNDKLKNEFISSISHELRTPLTSIKGWALTLKRKEFTGEVKREEALNIIVEESERLALMVEELLDFSRFQSGRITLHIDKIDIGKLLKNIIMEFQPRAQKSGIILTYNIYETILIDGDKNRLKQVFINILDNALKFTNEGEEICICYVENEENIAITIKDNGIGINKEDLKNITKKFYKGNSKKSGSGLGLAISNEIVNLHKGELNFESEYGKGTKVEVKLLKK